jgi:hypothetical protein
VVKKEGTSPDKNIVTKYLTRASKEQCFEVLESLKNTEKFALSKTESSKVHIRKNEFVVENLDSLG